MPSRGSDDDAPRLASARRSRCRSIPGGDAGALVARRDRPGPWWLVDPARVRADLPRAGRPRRRPGRHADRDRSAPLRRARVALRAHRRGRRPVADLQLAATLAVSTRAAGRSTWRASRSRPTSAGSTLAGGLRKFTPDRGRRRVRRHAARPLRRLRADGLRRLRRSRPRPATVRRASSLFGAVNGPIGGPPAFFLTGIGGGFGDQPRASSCPTDLSAVRRRTRSSRRSTPAARRRRPDGGARAAAATYFPTERGTVLVRRRDQLQQLRARRRHRRRRGRSSATGSSSTCSASRGWRCRGRRSPLVSIELALLARVLNPRGRAPRSRRS